MNAGFQLLIYYSDGGHLSTEGRKVNRQTRGTNTKQTDDRYCSLVKNYNLEDAEPTSYITHIYYCCEVISAEVLLLL